MTTAASRVQLNVTTYMPVDGQWCLVQPGSVIDLPAGLNISAASTVTLTEAPGTLAPHGGATSVRNVRKG